MSLIIFKYIYGIQFYLLGYNLSLLLFKLIPINLGFYAPLITLNTKVLKI